MERRRSRRSRRQVRKVLNKIRPDVILKLIIYGLCLWSFFYSEDQYAATLVSFQTILIIGIVSGVIASFIIERQYKYYLFSIILLGSLFTALYFKINRTFASHTEEKIKARILYKALKSSKTEHSRVTIEYNDFSRDIDIERIQEYLMAPSDFIVLTARKGGLGYYIITYKELVEN